MDKNAPKKADHPKDDQQKDMKLELEKAITERDDFKSKYLRALADYQNFERRMRDERTEISKIAQTSAVIRLLPFLDNLDQAEIFIKDKGLQMIKDQFYNTLKEMGLREIEMQGKEFDPHTAEAIDIVEGDTDNIIVEVIRKGYECDGKVLRPAQVKVSKKAI